MYVLEVAAYGLKGWQRIMMIEVYKHYDVNNYSIIDEKDRKEYCGSEEKAEYFYNNNEFFKKQ